MTDIPLLVHLEKQLGSLDRLFTQRFADMERAIALARQEAKEQRTEAKAENDYRLQAMNEFRGTIEDQANAFAKQESVDAQFRGVDTQLKQMASRLDKAEGRGSGVDLAWRSFAGFVGMIVGGIVAWAALN